MAEEEKKKDDYKLEDFSTDPEAPNYNPHIIRYRK